MGATREHSGRGKKKGKDSYLEQAGDTCVISEGWERGSWGAEGVGSKAQGGGRAHTAGPRVERTLTCAVGRASGELSEK